MISFQNGTKVRENVCCICIWVTQSVRYHHCSISMSVYCTAMYKLCDCWEKNIKKSSFRRNQLCRINCIYFFARPQEQTKLES